MSNFISKRIKTELKYFRSLSSDLRIFVIAFLIYSIAHPMLSIFVNAYFWRQLEGMSLIIVYNLGFFISLPIAFFLNGLILKKIHIKKMYLIGSILQGLAATAAIFQTNITIEKAGLFGLIYGLGAGFFWANKNFLSVVLSKGQNRVYYNALENTFLTLFKIVMPVTIGWIIAYGEIGGIYSVQQAYRWLMVVAFILILIGGGVLFKSKIKDVFSGKLLLGKVSKTWKKVRIFNIIYHSLSGINMFLPGVLVLYLLGNEGILGTVQSVAYLISSVFVYWIGRKSSTEKASKFFFISRFIFWLGTVVLAFNFSIWGVMAIVLAFSLSRSLGWVMSYPIIMEVMDREDSKREEDYRYAHVLDNELFFNVGRILGFAVFILFFQVSQDFALRFIPITLASAQLISWGILRNIAAEVNS